MPKINCLPKEISELIAAGEVIERPASIIKELVENSIDAKATRITVEIKRGGISYIRVTDNGCGISGEDLPIAFIRHATSKVSTKEDLDSILTMGFRGEALPSIAAVSKVEIISKETDEISAYRFKIEGSEEGEIIPAGAPNGTSIIVRDLFYNVPARIKFLKKDVTEGNAVAAILERLALANPDVAITFIRDGNVKFSTIGDGSLLTVVRLLMGSEFSSEMIEVSWDDGFVKVYGYIIKPTSSRANRASQHFIINGRYVRSHTCRIALEEAYGQRLMSARFPACVLSIEMKADKIDVNVHPAKLEVRFSDEKSVYNSIYAACRFALQENEAPQPKRFNPLDITSDIIEKDDISTLTKPLEAVLPDIKQEQVAETITAIKQVFSVNEKEEKPLFSSLSYVKEKSDKATEIMPNTSMLDAFVEDAEAFDIEKAKREYFPNETPEPLRDYNIADVFDSSQSSKKELEQESLIEESSKAVQASNENNIPTQTKPVCFSYDTIDFRVIGEIFSCFIVCSTSNELLLVDKHATHEKMLYNKLKRNLDEKSRQLTLNNKAVVLNGDDYRTVCENLSIIAEFGIIIDDMGDGTIVVKEMPLILVDFKLSEIIDDIISNLRNNKISITPAVLDEMLFSVACRCAVMSGDRSSYEDLRKLADAAINGEAKYCPHGRPTTVRMTDSEVRKMFGRTH